MKRASRSTKVNFLEIKEDSPPTSGFSTREAAVDEDSNPSSAGNPLPGSPEPAQEATESKASMNIEKTVDDLFNSAVASVPDPEVKKADENKEEEESSSDSFSTSSESENEA